MLTASADDAVADVQDAALERAGRRQGIGVDAGAR